MLAEEKERKMKKERKKEEKIKWNEQMADRVEMQLSLYNKKKSIQ